jgi:serine/threonine-protein kinase
MTRIYKVRRTNTRQEYALKTLIAGRLADAESLGRFRREVTLATLIRHDNVCQVADWGYWDDVTPYCVLELLDGASIEERVPETGRCDRPTVDLWLQGALAGLSAIHEAGVVHRGLHPGNLFVTQSGVCKVMDFGLAGQTALGDKEPWTAEGASLGLFPYVAPEQLFDARKVSVLADLYVLGLVYYRCVAGTLPYASSARRDILYGTTTGDMPALSIPCPETPAPLVEWVSRMLRVQPHDRYSSAQAALAALRAAQSG